MLVTLQRRLELDNVNLCNCLVLKCVIKLITDYLIQVYTRLHKLNLCASHRDTITSLDILGKGYDTKVMQWSNTFIPRIASKISVSINFKVCRHISIIVTTQ